MSTTSLKSFFQNKKIMVTGHTGFKGAWLTQILLLFGSKICGYALKPNTQPNLFDALELKKEIEHYLGDIRDFEALSGAMKKFKPDIIFHMAAQPLVRDSYDDPRYTYDVNVMGTVNILEGIRQHDIKAGIMVTTDKVYKNKERNIAYGEEDELGGYDPYSASKACDELIIASYIHSFFNPADYNKKHHTLIASVRAGNVIGGGDFSKDRLIPDIVKTIFNEEELIIRSPDAVRPWQHVLEPLTGYLMLAKNLYEGDASKVGAWNFGPEKKEGGIKVKDIVLLSINALGKGSCRFQKDQTRHEAGLLQLDITKAKKELHWKPAFNIKSAIRRTFDWYQNFYSKPTNIKTVTVDQIINYF